MSTEGVSWLLGRPVALGVLRVCARRLVADPDPAHGPVGSVSDCVVSIRGLAIDLK
jgi:hypothetical protein